MKQAVYLKKFILKNKKYTKIVEIIKNINFYNYYLTLNSFFKQKKPFRVNNKHMLPILYNYPIYTEVN
jgi:hypothetical protein